MISSTRKAEQSLKKVLLQELSGAGLGFRVRKDTNKPEGRIFSITLDSKHGDDRVVDLNGICVFLDPACAPLLQDCELDYQEEPAGFCLIRPQSETNSYTSIEKETAFGKAS